MSYKPATEAALNIELSLDERQALQSAAARLHTEFADTFKAEFIDRFVYSSYDQFADRATVHDFLALLAERFARQRLRARRRCKAKQPMTSRSCCFCATTTRADRKWPWGFSPI